MPPPRRCASMLSNGTMCRTDPIQNGDYCRRHHNINARKAAEDLALERRVGPVGPTQCHYIYKDAEIRCDLVRDQNSQCCVQHTFELAAERLKSERRRARAIAIQAEGVTLIQPILEVALDREPPLNWQDQLRQWYTTERDLRERGFLQRATQEFATMSDQRFTIREYEEQIRILIQDEYQERIQQVAPAVQNNNPGFLGRFFGGGQRPVVVPERTLADIATDKQNTHTKVVVEQTNKGLEKLLNYKIPAHQNTLYEIWRLWFLNEKSDYQGQSLLNVFQDMHKWYNTKNCKKPNDELYKKALDGIWFHIQNIQDIELRNQLISRLSQEIVESYDTCCEGHISRIVNVLAGFDKDFIPEGATKLDLQHEMGKLSQSNMSASAKKTEANKIMDRLKIPQTERAVWLDAFDG
jgi:hypothetical protein